MASTQTEGVPDRQRAREREIYTERQTQREREGQVDRENDRQTGAERERHTITHPKKGEREGQKDKNRRGPPTGLSFSNK